MRRVMRYAAVLILLGVLAAAGCGCEARYTTWSTDDGFSISFGDTETLPNFSLEYPSSFRQTTKVEEGELYDVGNYLYWGEGDSHSVRFVRLVNDKEGIVESYEDGAFSDISITIHISDMYNELINTFIELNSGIISFVEWYIKNFRIPLCSEELSITKMTIGGVPAYSRKCLFNRNPYTEKTYKNHIFKETLFKYDDVIIHIIMEAWEEEAEEVEEYYDHLLETFKIVE